MNSEEILKLLETLKRGNLTAEAAFERLKHLPFEDGFRHELASFYRFQKLQNFFGTHSF